MATITKNNKVKTDISKGEIRQIVVEVVDEVLSDPDFGLELQDWVKERLRKLPKKLIPFEDRKNQE